MYLFAVITTVWFWILARIIIWVTSDRVSDIHFVIFSIHSILLFARTGEDFVAVLNENERVFALLQRVCMKSISLHSSHRSDRKLYYAANDFIFHLFIVVYSRNFNKRIEWNYLLQLFSRIDLILFQL